MRVLIVNTSEKKGGAAVAANRLTEALINNGVKAKLLVMEKQTQSIYVASCVSRWWGMFCFILERLVIWIANLFSRKNLYTVSIANTGNDITRTPEFREADVIHLHWVNQGFLSLRSLRKILDSGKPVVWTMHDMWPCTSICHYSYGCMRFRDDCGECPFLRFPGRHDLSWKVMKKKVRLMKGRRINMVAVSNWLADQARQSAVTKYQNISVIPNALSLSHFHVLSRSNSRELLALPDDRKIIVFGAARVDAPIKGLHYLLDAVQSLLDRKTFRSEQLYLVLFGGIKDEAVLKRIPIDHSYLGFVDEDDLSAIYSASNVLVSSSLYETFGQTLIEAQACGCIPVSFNNSGQRDIIDHKVNGYLADYKSVESLADGLEWGLNADIPAAQLRNNVIRKYSESVVAKSYIELYNQIAKTKA